MKNEEQCVNCQTPFEHHHWRVASKNFTMPRPYTHLTMKLTLESKEKTVIIGVPSEHMDIQDWVQHLIVPALLAHGWDQNQIKDFGEAMIEDYGDIDEALDE
jgi:hypothetical protein